MPSPKSKVLPNASVRDRKYFQLWRRFYEPLVILRILGGTRGEHSPSVQQSPTHRFLDNLAYLCDYDKGGCTTSAVGLEDTPERFSFWVASNDPKHSTKAAAFLTGILHDVRRIVDSPACDKTTPHEGLVNTCIKFAERRVKKERGLLAREITNCIRFLAGSEDAEFLEWLGRFPKKQPGELCHLAYGERGTPMMKKLRGCLQSHGDLPVIKEVVHRLGRLAHHVRAPQQLIEDVSNNSALRNVLDEFEVHAIQPQAVVDRPEAEPDLRIDNIMKRMLPANGFNTQYQEAAEFMNRQFDIMTRFKQDYNSKNFKPQMHAEVQVLEHFFRRQRRFLDDDRYIGCSKPACYCCHLYMRHHPARCVVPQTSRKVYVHWGLGALARGSQDDGFKLQRDVINAMAKTIRDDALDQILRKASAAPWHPDSQTGFTLPAPSVRGGGVGRPGGRQPPAEVASMFDLDMATDTEDSHPTAAIVDSSASSPSASRHSSFASLSDTGNRGLRDVSWADEGDPGSDSDSSSGGAKL